MNNLKLIKNDTLFEIDVYFVERTGNEGERTDE